MKRMINKITETAKLDPNKKAFLSKKLKKEEIEEEEDSDEDDTAESNENPGGLTHLLNISEQK
jgi:hypothetical protein